MRRYLNLFCLLFIAFFHKSTENALPNQLRIGSFNIQSLGPTKMGRPEFVNTVVRILSKYDLILIQEIKDSSTGMTVTNQLLNALNIHVLYEVFLFNNFYYIFS
jgi:hypothetical protein